jgi:hypothetical protein
MQASVAGFVNQDQIGLPDKRRDCADIRQVATTEDNGVLGAFKRGELCLEALIQRMIARNQPRCAGPDAKASCRILARLYYIRVP